MSKESVGKMFDGLVTELMPEELDRICACWGRWRAALITTEQAKQRPQCSYPVTPPVDKDGKQAPPAPCGSERDLYKAHRTSGGEDVVCGKHKGDIWTRPDVISIDPLPMPSRTTG